MNIKALILALILSTGLLACSEPKQIDYKLSDTTNKEWIKGVSREWATAFFVKNTDQARNDFATGKKVILSDNSVRTVTGNQINGENLIVYLDGERLNGDFVGYPNSVKSQSR